MEHREAEKRFDALEGLLSRIFYVLDQFPEPKKKDVLGHAVAKSKLIGVGTTVIKEMGNLYRKEIKKAVKDPIRSEKDPSKVEARIKECSSRLEELVSETQN